jgi:predicted NAD/FAD-binding protein
VRVAIVGSGISGLVCAHLLHRRHDVTLFEAGDRPGGHTHTVEVRLSGRVHAVDTGFIVFNDRTYPNFSRLLRQLGVPVRPTTMSFGVRSDRTGLEYSGTGLGGLFAQRRNALRPRFLAMVRDILRFNREALRALGTPLADRPLRDLLGERGYSRGFVEDYLVPMGSAIWSMPPARLLDFPAGFFVRFFSNHGLLSLADRPRWSVIEGGSRTYVERLLAPLGDRVRLRTPVRNVRRTERDVELDPGGRFDHVVLACHSDQALALLADPTPAEREILGALPYQPNEVVLHTDASLLPRRRAAWAAWNYRIRADEGPAVVTYRMNEIQGLDAAEEICVTLNRTEEIAPSRVLGRFRYDHPAFTAEGVAAQRRHGEISGARGTHYCGAYWGYGFHEDGVNSALRVCEALGVSW